MPPVFGPVSPSWAFLKSVHGGRTTKSLPSLSPKIETSQPSRNSSTRSESSREDRSLRMRSAPRCRKTPGRPCPRQARSSSRRDAAPRWPRTKRSNGAASVNSSAAAVGRPFRTRNALENALLDSSRAAAVAGADARECPCEARKSTTPAASGSLGPDEHAVDAVRPARRLHACRKPGGFTAGRFVADLRGPRVARADKHPLHAAACRQLPCQGVLPAAGAEDEDFHEAPSLRARLGPSDHAVDLVQHLEDHAREPLVLQRVDPLLDLLAGSPCPSRVNDFCSRTGPVSTPFVDADDGDAQLLVPESKLSSMAWAPGYFGRRLG